MPKKLTTEEFIKRSMIIHKGFYIYNKTLYKGTHYSVIIECPIHGEFKQTPSGHLQKKGCPKCGIIKNHKNRKIFILKNKFNNIIQPHDYKIIPLSQDKFAKVDNEDFDMLKDIVWSCNKDGYATNSKKGFMHRYIIEAPKDMVTDHINRDILDNRRSNLRLCSVAQNNMNSFRTGNISSKYKGVSWNKSLNKWISSICLNRNNIYIGSFINEKEAAIAYNEKAEDIFGEFAYLNKID